MPVSRPRRSGGSETGVPVHPFRHQDSSLSKKTVPDLPRYRLAAPFQIMVRQGQANHDLKGCLSKVKVNGKVSVNV